MEAPVEDKNFKCKDCGIAFVWSVREQKLFQQRKLEHEPKRCIACRQKKREQKALDKTREPGGDMMAEG